MAITINGSGTITGVSTGGLPDGVVDADTLASNAVTTAKINADAVTAAKIADAVVNSEHLVNGGVDNAHLATGITSSKLSGALPAISGASLTNVPAAAKVAGEVVKVWTQYTYQGIQTSSTSFVEIPNTSLTVTPTSGNILIILFTFNVRKTGSDNTVVYHPHIGFKVDSTIVGSSANGLGIPMLAANCHSIRANISYRHVATSSSHVIKAVIRTDNASKPFGVCREHNSNQPYHNGQITVTEVKA